MPEGPEIRRAADKLEAAVLNKALTEVWFAFPQLKPFEQTLVGQSVERIETRGKALLLHFSNGLTMYSHNQLYGVWLMQVKRQTRHVFYASDCRLLINPFCSTALQILKYSMAINC